MKAITIVIGSALITAAAIKAAPVLAQPATPQLEVRVVRTADLDLRSERARNVLDRRLSNAAREVCGTAPDFDVEGKNTVRQCRDDVLARARAQTDVLLASAKRGEPITVAAAH